MRAAGPQRRFCDQCQLHVHDLSAMTRAEGAAFLSRTSGPSCVSFERRTDGSLVTRNRWSALAKRWQQARRGVLALLALLTPLSFAACSAPDRYRTGGTPCITGNADGKDTPKETEAAEHGGRTLGRVSIPPNPR